MTHPEIKEKTFFAIISELEVLVNNKKCKRLEVVLHDSCKTQKGTIINERHARNDNRTVILT